MPAKPKLKLPNNVLKHLEKKIAERVPNHLNPFIELADLLDLSKESIYRRFRGDTPFTLDEIWKISNVYKFSVDDLLQTINGDTGVFRLIDSSQCTLQEVVLKLQQIVSRSINDSTYRLYVFASDIPILRIVNYSNLFHLKWFHWQTNAHASLQKEPRITLNHKPNSELSYDQYLHCNPYEFWPATILNTTLSQIHYYNQCNALIDEEMLYNMYSELITLVDDAIFKHENHNLVLYQYELALQNVVYLVDQGTSSFVAFTLSNSSIIYSDSAALITQYQTMKKQITQDSVKLTHQSIRNKVAFAALLKSKIFRSAKRILSDAQCLRLREQN